LLLEARLLRRVVKAATGLAGFGLRVPHDEAWPVGRALFLETVAGRWNGGGGELPEELTLLARPGGDDIDTPEGRRGALWQGWRAIFHCRVHRAMAGRFAGGELTEAGLRARIHRIGQTEFDEIRYVLEHDGRLPHGSDDRAVYTEFAAMWLELGAFDPHARERTFPAIDNPLEVTAALALDLDPEALLAETRPEGMTSPEEGRPRRQVAERDPVRPLPAPLAAERDRAREEAEAATRVGNHVRAALLYERAACGGPHAETESEAARQAARGALGAVVEGLAAALGVDGSEHGVQGAATEGGLQDPAAWRAGAVDTLEAAARWAAEHGAPTRTLEARLLYDLQKACTEQDVRSVDVVGWALSFGRRRVVRPLPASRMVRISRHLRHAENKLARVRLPHEARHALADFVHGARRRADGLVRATLGPRIEEVLDRVGLAPCNHPEKVARAKIVAELLDQVVARGFLALGHVRDALSRSNLKLDPLSGPREFFLGDALLQADTLLADALDGVYRGGEIYMRGLQRISSLLFGTWLGRLATLYLILPFGAAFVVLEGLTHLVHPVAARLGAEVHLVSMASVLGVGTWLFGLLHAPLVRRLSIASLRAAGRTIRGLFYDGPRWLLARPPIRALFASRTWRRVVRFALKPALLAAVGWVVTLPLGLHWGLDLALTAGLFVTFNLLLNSNLGLIVEEAVADAATRTWHALSSHLLPGLFALLMDWFRTLLEWVERGLYQVDERLRFRRGEGRGALWWKGAAGVLWFYATYFVRIYVNLLIEPQVNPIKHFPVVTVSHKIILPMSPQIIDVLRLPFEPLGPVIANAIAGPTMVLLPGVFGFLVWEFKENWKLYKTSRPDVLRPVRVGHHGETVGALLKPGFHSGTAPKAWAKLRRALRRGSLSVSEHEEAVHHIGEAARTFVERELAALLAMSPRWTRGPLHVGHVEIGSNRIRVPLCAPQVGPGEITLCFEEQSGWILASLTRGGLHAPGGHEAWIDALEPCERALFDLALSGLYKLAGVELTREQIAGALGEDVPWDVSGEGLLAWPCGSWAVEWTYDLRADGPIEPVVSGEAGGIAPKVVDVRALRCAEAPLRWSEWVAAWG